MIKLDQFDMWDEFNWPKRKILREALDAAKRHAEMMWYQARAVSIVKVKEHVDDALEIFGVKGENKNFTVYTIQVWGHEIEVPDEFKHWTERLANNAHLLTVGDAWDGL